MTRTVVGLAARERDVLSAMIASGAPAPGDPVTPADRARWAARVDATRDAEHCPCGACPTVDLCDARGRQPALGGARVVLSAEADGLLALLFIDDDHPSRLEGAPVEDGLMMPVFPPSNHLVFDSFA